MKLDVKYPFLLGVGLGLGLGVLGGVFGAKFFLHSSSLDVPSCSSAKQMSSPIQVANKDSSLSLNLLSDSRARPSPTLPPITSPLTLKALNVDEVDLSRRLEGFAHEKPVRGIGLEQTASPRGGTHVIERLQEGMVAEREYNTKNILIDEKIDLPNGERLYRSYFESGAIKSVNLTLQSGVQTTLMQDSTGISTNRTDLLPNGDMISYEFDDTGSLNRRWYIRKGEKSVLME